MSSLKDTYCTPTYVSGWDAREEGGRHLQEQFLNTLLFPLGCCRRHEDRLSCLTEFAVDLVHCIDLKIL